MSDLTETKICPGCAETIKAAVKVCPFCQSRQSRLALLGYEIVGVLIFVGLGTLAIAVIAWVAPDEKRVGGRSFSHHRNDLIAFGETLGRAKAKPDYWLTGYVTNRGEHPWRVHELEVRFLDGRGSLLDVRHTDVKDLFVVQPQQEHSFRVELGELAFTNNDVIQQVRVQSATDGNRLFKRD